jgi:CRISPR system Cascade subunit CasD
MKYCIIQIYAPLVSWGDIAVGMERPSMSYPGKSALLGLIGAAFGIRRDEEEKHTELRNAFRFGVKQLCSGTIIRDFHTAQHGNESRKIELYNRRDELNKSEKIDTVLSYREYICDVRYLAAIWIQKGVRTEITLEHLQEKIRNPVFTIYFGRKCCPPALPLDPKIITAGNVKEALDSVPTQSIIKWAEHNKKWYEGAEKYERRFLFQDTVYYHWERSGDEDKMNYTQKTYRYDDPLSRKRRQYGRREEFSFSEVVGGES